VEARDPKALASRYQKRETFLSPTNGVTFLERGEDIKKERRKMKKMIHLITMIFLFSVFVQADITPEKACAMMRASLLDVGMDVDITTDKKGDEWDFNFECVRWYRARITPNKTKSQQQTEIAKLYGGIVAAVGTITTMTKWKSDKAWVLVNGRAISYFYTKDCRRVIKLPLWQQAHEVVKIKHSV